MINKFVFLTSLISLLVLPTLSQNSQHQYVGYFFTQSENNANSGNGLKISQVPPYVTTLIIGSIQPDSQYQAGSLDLSGTGITLAVQGSVFRDGIRLAKQKQRVLIQIGDFGKINWEGLNTDAIANLVSDFGFDGVEINFRVRTPNCQVGNTVRCDSDKLFQSVVANIRQALPNQVVVAAAITAVGAYGQGNFKNSQPQNAQTGFAVNLLKSNAGGSLDLINIQSFEGGEGYDFEEGFRAFKSLFQGPVTIGLDVPPEGTDDADILSVSDIQGLCEFVIQNGGNNDGMSLTSLDRRPDGSISDDNPDPTITSQAICNEFDLQQCDATVDSLFM